MLFPLSEDWNLHRDDCENLTLCVVFFGSEMLKLKTITEVLLLRACFRKDINLNL
jgi:hypothetical protein